MARIQIEINECPYGHKVGSHIVRCLSVGNTRVTSFKCCGSWQTVQSWTVNSEDLLKAIDEAAFDAMREQGRKNRAKIYA